MWIASPVLKRVPRILARLPARAEIARAHLGVGLEPAGGEHDAARLHLDGAAVMFDAHAFDAVIIGNEGERARIVGETDPVLFGDLGVHVDETWPAAPGFHRQAAPELELAVHLVGLPTIDRNEADALLLHPAHGLLAARDQGARRGPG